MSVPVQLLAVGAFTSKPHRPRTTATTPKRSRFVVAQSEVQHGRDVVLHWGSDVASGARGGIPNHAGRPRHGDWQ